MAGLQSYTYPGFGEWMLKNSGLRTAIRVGDRIEISGQGGWDPDVSEYPKLPVDDIAEEIAVAFSNVQRCLENAGGKGWSQVFRVNSYHTDLTPEVQALMKKGFEKWMPNHQPVYTQIGVKQLGAPDMHVEIEVVAFDPREQ